MIKVAKKVRKNYSHFKTLVSLTSLQTLFKTYKVQIFVKLKFKLLLPKTVSPIHP
jgi:hypothetical protein